MTIEENGDSQPGGGSSRRRVLAGLCGGTLAATAGCLTTMPSLGQQVQFGSVDEPSASEPIYREWIPDQLPNEDRRGGMLYISPNEQLRSLFSIGHSVILSQLDYVGVNFDEFDHAMSIGSVAVALGSIGSDIVADAFDGTGYSETEPIGELMTYSRDDTNRTVAVGDGIVLSASHTEPSDRRDGIEHVYNTGQGEAARLVDTDATFDQVSDRIGASPFTSLNTGGTNSFDGNEEHPDSDWWSTEFRFDDEYAYYITTLAYPPDEEASRRYLEETVYDGGLAHDARNVDVRVDGRFGVIVSQFNRAGPFDDDSEMETPHVTWGVKDDADLTISHEAGDAVDAGLLRVEGRGTGTGSPEPLSTQFDDEFDRVEPGDQLVLPASAVEAYHSISIVIDPPNDDSRWIIFDYNRD